MNLKKEFYKILTIALVVAYCLHTSSCASTKAAPSGGPKDTIPPVVLAMNPADNATDFPVEDGEITITFDEYVQVKDPAKNIIVSRSDELLEFLLRKCNTSRNNVKALLVRKQVLVNG